LLVLCVTVLRLNGFLRGFLCAFAPLRSKYPGG